MKEDNNFVSRVKRYSKVTTSLTSLATQFAGKKYLNFDLSDQKYAAQITEILGNLKGPLMKVAQLSATIPDLLPQEYAQKLAELDMEQRIWSQIIDLDFILSPDHIVHEF